MEQIVPDLYRVYIRTLDIHFLVHVHHRAIPVHRSALQHLHLATWSSMTTDPDPVSMSVSISETDRSYMQATDGQELRFQM